MPKKKEQAVSRKRTPNVDLNHSEDEQKDLQKTNVKASFVSLEVRRQKVLQFLGGNQMPKCFNYRDDQVKQIRSFIEDCLNKKNKNRYKILMVTGSPGAGKSLSVNHILTNMEKQKVIEKVIKFNANIVKTVRDVQNIICSEILDRKFGNQMSTVQILRLLEQQKIKKKYVLYIEEVEIILEQKTNIFTEDFFMLFSNPKINIMMLGISNTIDAMAKYSKNICINLNEIKNIVFEPYSHETIVKIIKQKLLAIEKNYGFKIVANDKVLNFIGAKIQNLKRGDVRIVLEFLKELANKILPKSAEETKDLMEEGYQVSISLAQSVFTKMRSPKNEIISALPHTQQIVLLALYLYTKESDCLFLLKKQIEQKTKWVCDSLGLEYHIKMVPDGLEQLEQYSLISVTKKVNEERVVLKVSLAEVEVALEQKPLLKKFFDKKEEDA